MDPISRSTYGFCHGLDGAETSSVIPMPASRWQNRLRVLIQQIVAMHGATADHVRASAALGQSLLKPCGDTHHD